MNVTSYADGTKIYSVWFTKSCGLAFHIQVRARDRIEAEDRVCVKYPDAFRLIAEPDEVDPSVLDETV